MRRQTALQHYWSVGQPGLGVAALLLALMLAGALSFTLLEPLSEWLEEGIQTVAGAVAEVVTYLVACGLVGLLGWAAYYTLLLLRRR